MIPYDPIVPPAALLCFFVLLAALVAISTIRFSSHMSRIEEQEEAQRILDAQEQSHE